MYAGIVLAAGASTRLGQPKQLLRLGGQTLVRRVTRVALAAGLDPVIVVVGHAAPAVRAEVADLPVTVVENPAYAEGQSTSLVAGLRALPPATRAVLVFLVDQPFVTAEIVRRLLATYEETGQPIVVPVHAGQRGHPVLFDSRLLPDLLAITGDRGAREVIQRHGGQVALVTVATDAVLRDIDTWDDYQAAVLQTAHLADEQ